MAPSTSDFTFIPSVKGLPSAMFPPPGPVTVFSTRISAVDDETGIFCEVCRKSFPSLGRYNNHFLSCEPPNVEETPVATAGGSSSAHRQVENVAITSNGAQHSQQPLLPRQPSKHSAHERGQLTQSASTCTDADRAKGIKCYDEPITVKPGPSSFDYTGTTTHADATSSPANNLHRSQSPSLPPSSHFPQPSHSRPDVDSGRESSRLALPSFALAHQRPTTGTSSTRTGPTASLVVPPRGTLTPGPRSNAVSAQLVAGQSTVNLNTRSLQNSSPMLVTATPASGASDSLLSGEYRCNRTKACNKSFMSKAALKQHCVDVHGIGGNGIIAHPEETDLFSRAHTLDNITNQRIRGELQQQGLLRSTPAAGPPGSHNIRPVPSRPSRPNVAPVPSPRAPRNGASGLTSSSPLASSSPSYALSSPVPRAQLPTSISVGGPEDMNQAQAICDKIVRLQLQDDVLIYHTGKMLCSGIEWIRVGVARQAELVGMFEPLCHLPLSLQYREYVPQPKAFKDDHRTAHSVADFQLSPAPSPSKPALSIVAISCIRVVMANGREEAVRFAAIDVTTCRILINNLVCMDPKDPVRDWRPKITGISSLADMEAARQDGYKIFKGWQAARAALWQFIDNKTIIVGHHLRPDLDALRMVHGRAVDVAKLIEKAASGPLSKQQLSLDTLCRDLATTHLTTHPTLGRDALQNAFAARELVLWKIKNEDKWTKWAKAKSIDYQRVSGIRA